MADGGEGAGASESASEGSASTGAEMPAGVPSKFWNADAGSVNYEAWGKATGELEGKLRTQKSDLTKELSESLRTEWDNERFANRPETPNDYEMRVPEGMELPEGMEWEFSDDDPMLGWWKETVHEMGGNQEMFDAGVQQFIEAQLGSMPDVEAEMEALGEYGESRVERVQLWAQKNLGEDMMPAMAEMMSSAKNIEVVEAIMDKMGEAPFSSQEATAFGKGDSYADLREMQNDPRYWDPLNRDRAFVKKVEDGYRELEAQERRGRG